LGLALLAAAVWAVAKDASNLRDAWLSIKASPPLLLLALFALPLASWSLTALMYCALTNRDRDIVRRRHVGVGEMHAVLGTAWLLNFLPARPGMVGRIAYHTQVNRIPLPSVLKASLGAIACGVLASALLVALALAMLALPHATPALAQVALLALPAALLAASACALRTREALRRGLLALLARYLDVLTWLARYATIFAMLGRPLSLLEASALTAASQAANMVPLVGNGMGIREWASALLAPALPPSTAAAALATPLTRSLTLSAELIHRAAEILVAIPVGLVSLWFVTRRLTSTKA
jgi:hypothetical protein